MALDAYLSLNVAANIAAVVLLLALFISHVSDKKSRRAHTQALKEQTAALKELRETTSITHTSRNDHERKEDPPWMELSPQLPSTRKVQPRTRVRRMG